MATDDESLRALWGAAVAAYVGRGARKIPTADEAALFAVAPDRFDQLLPLVKQALLASDSIRLEGVPRHNAKDAVTHRLRELLPDLDDRGIDALAWRWGFIAFHG